MHRNLLKARALLLFIVISIASQHTNAQASIQGRIIDSSKSGISQATVMLLQSADSSLIRTFISNRDGAYVFNNIPQGRYLVAAEFIGYKRAYSEFVDISNNRKTVIVGPLTLREGETISLGTVIVSAKKPLLEQKIDRVVI